MNNKFFKVLLSSILLITSASCVEAKHFDHRQLILNGLLGAFDTRVDMEDQNVEVWTDSLNLELEDVIDNVKNYIESNQVDNPYIDQVLASDKFCIQYQYTKFDLNRFENSRNGLLTVAKDGPFFFSEEHTWKVNEKSGDVSNELKIKSYNPKKGGSSLIYVCRGGENAPYTPVSKSTKSIQNTFLHNCRTNYNDTMEFMLPPMEQTTLYWADGRKVQRSGFSVKSPKFLGARDIECKGIKLHVKSYEWKVGLGAFLPKSFWDYYYYNDRLVMVNRVAMEGPQRLLSYWYFILGYTNNFDIEELK